MIHLLEKFIDLIFAIIAQKKPHSDILHNVRIIAHRGIHNSTTKENTIEAFDAAVKAKCYGIELDIHATQDNEIIINHDADLNRIWGENLIITKSSLQTIKNKIPQIPTLKDVIAKHGKKIHLFIELKSPFYAFKQLQETLTLLTPVNDYHLITLDEKLLPLLEQYFPKKALFPVATQTNFLKFYKIALEKKYAGWLGHYLFINKKQIKNLKNNKQISGVGFIASKNSLYREINRGINYIFTDNAIKILEILENH